MDQKQTKRLASLQDVISRRILVLDGAMGTMIQQYDLAEEDFCGERFAFRSCGCATLAGPWGLTGVTRFPAPA